MYKRQEYEEAGAKMIDSAKEVWDTVEMMIKVKEPLPEEYPLFHEGLILYKMCIRDRLERGHQSL